jgi:hypothetical protein
MKHNLHQQKFLKPFNVRRSFSTFLLLFIICFSQTIFAQDSDSFSETNYPVANVNFTDEFNAVNFEVISRSQFERLSPRLNSCHIGQIQSVNPSVDMKLIDAKYDFTKLNFIHDQTKSIAYILYTGEVLVVKPNSDLTK